MRPVDRAYIAAFFDGEGCVHFLNRGKHRPRLIVYQKDPEVLAWMRETLGFGHLYTYHSKRWDNTMSCLVFASKSDVWDFISVVYKHSKVKRRALAKARRNLERR